MQNDPLLTAGEMLRASMRHWVTGVAIVTSAADGHSHGMTVNSLVSISLDPPLIAVTLAHNTRTYQLVQQSGLFAVTLLSDKQVALAERFAGRGPEPPDRMAGLDTFTLVSGAPLIRGGVAFIDCRVAHQHPLKNATLMLGEVLTAQTTLPGAERPPLVYYNRTFKQLG